MRAAGCGTWAPTTAGWVSSSEIPRGEASRCLPNHNNYLLINIFLYCPARGLARLLRATLVAGVALAAHPVGADEGLWERLKAGGHVILIRHAATEPGVGDPPGFRVEDCATQRNLSAAGREQAARLGATIRRHGIPIARVRSSRWCRCLETARIAFGSAESWPALDNTYEAPQRRDPQMREVRAAVAAPPHGGNLVLVTHGVNIHALTGISPGTAELVIAKPGATLTVIGRIAAP